MSTELALYKFSIFDYLRKNDPVWRKQIDALKTGLCLFPTSVHKENKLPKNNSGIGCINFNLPDEVIFEIMKYFDCATLLFATCVSRNWNLIASMSDEL